MSLDLCTAAWQVLCAFCSLIPILSQPRKSLNMSPVILVHFGSHFSTVHFEWYFSTLHFVGRILVHLESHFGSFLIGYFLNEKVSIHSSFLTPHLQSFFSFSKWKAFSETLCTFIILLINKLRAHWDSTPGSYQTFHHRGGERHLLGSSVDIFR